MPSGPNGLWRSERTIMSELTNGGRARAYQALRESEELHRATLSHISDAVFITEPPY